MGENLLADLTPLLDAVRQRKRPGLVLSSSRPGSRKWTPDHHLLCNTSAPPYRASWTGISVCEIGLRIVFLTVYQVDSTRMTRSVP